MSVTHAKLAPSSAHRWLKCAASLALESTLPDRTSKAANKGTCAHALAEMVLNRRLSWDTDCEASQYSGEQIIDEWGAVDDEIIDIVNAYVDVVWAMAQGNTLHVENRVDFSNVIDVPDSFGTADAIIISGNELQVHDLKSGRYPVCSEDNPQLQLYALGAVQAYGLVNDIQTVRLCIHQPVIGNYSEWVTSVSELHQFGETAKLAAKRAVELTALDVDDIPTCFFSPGEKQCKFCKAANGLCAAQAKAVTDMITDKFEDLTIAEKIAECDKRVPMLTVAELAEIYSGLGTMENFCKGVRERVEQMFENGEALPGFKQIDGRRGARTWKDPDKVEMLLRDFGYKEHDVYEKKLLTPPRVEKAIKKANPEAWGLLDEWIIQAPGNKIVVKDDFLD